MHSFAYRSNALFTFGVTILAIMCIMVSVSDNFNTPSPQAQIEVLKINRFKRQQNGNDEVSLTMNISADLQSLFTWNTKQVFIFVAAEYETPKNVLNQRDHLEAKCLSRTYPLQGTAHQCSSSRFFPKASSVREVSVEGQCLPRISQPGHPGSSLDSSDGVIRFHIGASMTEGDRSGPSPSTSTCISIYAADNECRFGMLSYLQKNMPSFQSLQQTNMASLIREAIYVVRNSI